MNQDTISCHTKSSRMRWVGHAACMENYTHFSLENVKERDNTGDMGGGGRIIKTDTRTVFKELSVSVHWRSWVRYG
jgi:hypothetical protein